VFAREKIPARKMVIEYTGEKVRMKEALRRLTRVWSPGGSKCVLIFELNERWCVDAGRGGSGAELINHCCDPNLVTRIIRGRIFFFSRRRIRAGEELTLDYRFHPDVLQVPCACGSPKCRGTINLKRNLGRDAAEVGGGGRRRRKHQV